MWKYSIETLRLDAPVVIIILPFPPPVALLLTILVLTKKAKVDIEENFSGNYTNCKIKTLVTRVGMLKKK